MASRHTFSPRRCVPTLVSAATVIFTLLRSFAGWRMSGRGCTQIIIYLCKLYWEKKLPLIGAYFSPETDNNETGGETTVP